MKLTGLQFGFCVSLGIHAVVFGAITAGGLAPYKTRLPVGDRDHVIKLTLTIAPEESVAEPEKQTVPPPVPMPVAQTEAPHAVVTKPIPPLLPVEEAKPTIQPTSLLLSPVQIQQERVVATPALEAAPAAASQNRLRSGGSSPQAAEDAITLPATFGIRVWPGYRKNPKPAYPLAARRQRQEGIVLLSVKVTAQGQVERVEVRQSSGFSALDEAAIQAVRDWEFEPARIGSKPVASEIEVPVRFKLKP